MLPYNRKLKVSARELRRKMTEEEHLLWSRIRRKQLSGAQFYRQKPLGDYIVDFYCPASNLVVEIDGAHHFSADGREYDSERADVLKNLGLTVMRFSNAEVQKNMDAVIQKIIAYLESHSLKQQSATPETGIQNFL